MNIKTRFAPSPTGLLHIGSARTALINYLFTKSNLARNIDSTVILRIDDTDKERSKKEYEESIIEDLKWLGLGWDKFIRQSEHLANYENAKNKLISDGRLYECFETAQELEIKRKILLNRNMPPIYDRSSLRLTKEQRQKFIDEGRKPHYRFLLEKEKIIWNDLIRNEISFDSSNLSDPILIREDGTMTYMLCSVVDDLDYNITHIIRGEDHISNTAISVQIIRSLGGNIPEFAHLSLMKTKEGKMSKRVGGFDIRRLRDDFIEPMSINSLLAKLGTSESPEASFDMDQLIREFDLKKFSRSIVNYDEEDLIRINHKLLSKLKLSDVQCSLKSLNIDITEQFWEYTKNNISKLDDINHWHKICNKPIMPVINSEDKEFIIKSRELIPSEDLNESSWDIWIERIKTYTDRKGKNLFMPIRLAITGEEHGPELKHMLPLIGKEKLLGRLNGNFI